MAQLNYSFRVPNKSITFCELLSNDSIVVEKMNEAWKVCSKSS